MQKMKFYIITGYAAFFVVAFSLLFIFTIAVLSFHSLNELPTALGTKLIVAATQFSENSRLIIIFFVTGILLLITLVGAYLLRSFCRSLQILTYAMNKIAYSENGLKDYMQTTLYPEINKVLPGFNKMVFHLDNAQNKLREKIFLGAQESNEINKYLETKVDELSKLKISAELARQAKSEFLSMISHELRTPLNAILGYSEILQEDAEESGYAKYCTYFENIINSANNLLVLINATFEEKKSTHVNLFKLN